MAGIDDRAKNTDYIYTLVYKNNTARKLIKSPNTHVQVLDKKINAKLGN